MQVAGTLKCSYKGSILFSNTPFCVYNDKSSVDTINYCTKYQDQRQYVLPKTIN